MALLVSIKQVASQALLHDTIDQFAFKWPGTLGGWVAIYEAEKQDERVFARLVAYDRGGNVVHLVPETGNRAIVCRTMTVCSIYTQGTAVAPSFERMAEKGCRHDA